MRALSLALASTLLLASTAAAEPLDADACVAVALRNSPEIIEAEAKVDEWKAKLAEVESVFYPKLSAVAFVAPMFTVRGDINGFRRRWKSFRDWGPYTSLEAFLAQPLYTFGRADAGETAARERMLVEQARVRETELVVALEIKKMYWMRAYALSMAPSLKNAAEIIETAQEKGREMFDEGDGSVTQADLSKLEYAATEIAKLRLQASEGALMALAALKHLMGMPATAELELADGRLPKQVDIDVDSLDLLIADSARLRPEWAQLNHGAKAAEALEQAEKLAMLPVIGIAGQFRASWTPTRDDSDNPYHLDPYNDLFGGVALGLMWDFDPALNVAKAAAARSLAKQVESLRAFAETGIPTRVRKAHSDVTTFREMANLSAAGVKAARKWMLFSAAAYASGSGEAKDVLEGVIAYLQAKNGQYESLQGYRIALAELDFAVGRGGRPPSE